MKKVSVIVKAALKAKAIYNAICMVKYIHSVAQFRYEVKDNYLWGISLYQVTNK